MLLLNPQALDQLSQEVRTSAIEPFAALLTRAKLLHAKDQLLLEMALKHRLSRRQMGMVLGLAAGSVSRKVRRLLNRLHDPFVVALSDPGCSLAPDYRQLAVEHFIHGQTMAKLARMHGISRQEVRTMLEYVRGWHKGRRERI